MDLSRDTFLDFRFNQYMSCVFLIVLFRVVRGKMTLHVTQYYICYSVLQLYLTWGVKLNNSAIYISDLFNARHLSFRLFIMRLFTMG